MPAVKSDREVDFQTFFSFEDISARLLGASTRLRQRILGRAVASASADVPVSAFEHSAIQMWETGFLSDHPLDQLLCAWLPGALPHKLKALRLHFDTYGHAYLPRIGVVDGLGTRQERILRNVEVDAQLQVHRRPTRFSTIILGAGVTVLDGADSKGELGCALELLHRNAPELTRRLQRVTSEIVIFAGLDRNSLVHQEAPNTVFICVNEKPTISFFIEELAHQCGHLLLLAATEDPASYFSGSWNEPLENSEPDDTRSRYVVLHGLFTLAAICSALESVLQEGSLGGRESLEAIGRIALASRRFEKGALRILDSNVLSAQGMALLRSAAAAVGQGLTNYFDIATRLDLSTQGYAFSSQAFFSSNRAPA